MASNTKLLDFQKFDLEVLRALQKDVKIVNNGKTTIAYRVLPNTVEFSLSVASPDEKKFRAKVGEFCARSRMDSGETVKMRKADFYLMMEVVCNTYLG
jgi:hypothetical protein